MSDEAAQADAAFHDATAHVYEQTLDQLFRAYTKLTVVPWLDALPALTTGKDALDVGCGTGAMTVRLAERGYRVRGTDHSQGMLDIAERNLRERGLSDRVELSLGDVNALPYDDDQFDVAACQGVLHHLRDMRPCLAEIKRVLRPGGVFYLAEPCEGSTPPIRVFERLSRVKARVSQRKRIASFADAAAPIPHHEEGPISAAALTAILDELGLEHEVTYWGTFLGLHRVRPLWLQRWVIVALSRPWSHSSGNALVVRGRKVPGPRGAAERRG